MTQENIVDQKKQEKKKEKIAVIRIRGMVRVNTDIQDTLFFLRLRKKHVCVVLEKSNSASGMLRKAKDYITYGEIDEETEKELISKRGKKDEEGKLKPFFELAPPRGGFERKGIKKSFQQGGVLGYRGKNINDLIKRML
ncbi:MAG: uL30 family ribosomal protein [Nanoarchaeota archaeon]|nr:uL30 family ribosomal protein [Nanoarchaeota archaeon]MBU1269148.1 uL30 family ribosomal protein [Nanoarchaeota archaeon]MBU1605110.1 uL30 family ribosomal protein [Nanoarchaeota archaeon]MBU2442791.1 uL30 family ribosomal protein [Nanoarchaeota archaeon]